MDCMGLQAGLHGVAARAGELVAEAELGEAAAMHGAAAEAAADEPD